MQPDSDLYSIHSTDIYLDHRLLLTLTVLVILLTMFDEGIERESLAKIFSHFKPRFALGFGIVAYVGFAIYFYHLRLDPRLC